MSDRTKRGDDVYNPACSPVVGSIKLDHETGRRVEARALPLFVQLEHLSGNVEHRINLSAVQAKELAALLARAAEEALRLGGVRPPPPPRPRRTDVPEYRPGVPRGKVSP